MAIIHKASLTPTKAELMAAWLPQQDWYDGAVPATPRPVATLRLDDPDGEVGIEVILLEVGARTWLVPLTYRAEPLDGGAGHLVGTLEHSVLGPRYVYDALGDPVFLDVVRSTIENRGREADVVRDLGDGSTEPVASTLTARGTGGEGVDVVVERTPPVAADGDLADGSASLVGRFADRPDVVLVRLA